MAVKTRALLPGFFANLPDSPGYDAWRSASRTFEQVAGAMSAGTARDSSSIPNIDALWLRFDGLIESETDSEERKDAVRNWQWAFLIADGYNRLGVKINVRFLPEGSRLLLPSVFLNAAGGSNDWRLPHDMRMGKKGDAAIYTFSDGTGAETPFAMYSNKYVLIPWFDFSIEKIIRGIIGKKIEAAEFLKEKTAFAWAISTIEAFNYVLNSNIKRPDSALRKIMDDFRKSIINETGISDTIKGKRDSTLLFPGMEATTVEFTDFLYVLEHDKIPKDTLEAGSIIRVKSSEGKDTKHSILLPIKVETVAKGLKSGFFRDMKTLKEYFRPYAEMDNSSGEMIITVRLKPKTDTIDNAGLIWGEGASKEEKRDYLFREWIGLDIDAMRFQRNQERRNMGQEPSENARYEVDDLKCFNPPFVAVWPKKKDPLEKNGWKYHYLFQSEGTDTIKGIRFGHVTEDSIIDNIISPEAWEGEFDDKKVRGIYPNAVKRIGVFPSFLCAVARINKKTEELGILPLPIETLPPIREKRVLIGVDFGTSGTVAFSSVINSSSEEANLQPEEILFEEFDVLLALGIEGAFATISPEMFIPKKSASSDKSNSIQTLLRQKKGSGTMNPLEDVNILFTKGSDEGFNMDFVKSNLKWGVRLADKRLSSLFLSQFMGMTLYKAFERGAGEVFFRFSYSSALGRMRNEFKEFCDKLVYGNNNQDPPMNNMTWFTGVTVSHLKQEDNDNGIDQIDVAKESFAVGLFLKSAEMAGEHRFKSLDIRAVNMLIDIGGGSTDISVWYSKIGENIPSCLASTSFHYAGQCILIDNIRRLFGKPGDEKNKSQIEKFLEAFGVNLNSFTKDIQKNVKDVKGELSVFRTAMEFIIPKMTTTAERIEELVKNGGELSEPLSKLRDLISFNLSAIVFFAAHLINDLIVRRKIELEESEPMNVRVVVTGNGSRLLDWLENNNRLESALKKSLKNKSTISIEKSVSPKKEVAAGLVAVYNYEGGETDKSEDMYRELLFKYPTHPTAEHKKESARVVRGAKSKTAKDLSPSEMSKNLNHFSEYYLQDLFELYQQGNFFDSFVKAFVQPPSPDDKAPPSKPVVVPPDTPGEQARKANALKKAIVDRILGRDASKNMVCATDGIEMCLSFLNDTAYNGELLQQYYKKLIEN